MPYVILILVLALAQAAAPTQPKIAGVWKLNTEKSTIRVPPGATEMRQYTMRPDGFLVGLVVTIVSQGFHTVQFTAKSDGKDYPEYSDLNIAEMIAAGTPTVRTYAEKIIDEYTTEWIAKMDGRITSQGRRIVAPDGKTLTITIDGSPLVRVYDRQ